jgi:uncharacterized protein (DUF2236 family)
VSRPYNSNNLWTTERIKGARLVFCVIWNDKQQNRTLILTSNSIALMPIAITLPQPLQRRLDAAVDDFIYPAVEDKNGFLHPAGEPALATPDSVSWQVFKNPLALFIGGVAAVILELAEPRVRSGVWNHTTFRHDPLPRLQRTGLAAMMTVYGPRSRAEAMITGIARMHQRISGSTPDGLPYQASDSELLNWVHATASFGFLQAYKTYACTLDDANCDRFYAEGACSARLYGALGAPASQSQTEALFQRMQDKLEASAIVFEFLELMRCVPLLPGPLRPVQTLLIKAAVEILPASIRERLGLRDRWYMPVWQRRIVRRLGGAADRLWLGSSPAVQSCRRLGLPGDYLYTHRLK